MWWRFKMMINAFVLYAQSIDFKSIFKEQKTKTISKHAFKNWSQSDDMSRIDRVSCVVFFFLVFVGTFRKYFPHKFDKLSFSCGERER